MDEKDLDTFIIAHAKEIVRTLENISPETSISVIDKRIRSQRFGNPYSRFKRGDFSFRFGGEDSIETSHPIQFFLQHFNGASYLPDQIAEEPADLKFFIYDLYKNSGITPSPFLIEGCPEVILLSSSGDLMLEERLVGQNLKERERLNRESLSLLSVFHNYGQKIMATLVANKTIMDAIAKRAETPHTERGLRYLRAFYQRTHGKPPSEALENEFREGFSPVAMIYDRAEFKTALEHGDYGSQNVVGKKEDSNWNASNMKIIDLTNLRFNHPMIGAAKQSTSHNVFLTPIEWNESIGYYIERSAAQTYDTSFYSSNLGKFFGRTILLKEDVERVINTAFYAGAISEPWKTNGYVDTLFVESARRKNESGSMGPTKYDVWVFEKPTLRYTREQMGRNSMLALDYILNGKKPRFLWTDEQFNQLERLKRLWKDIGYLPEKDNVKELLPVIAKGYQERDAKLRLAG